MLHHMQFEVLSVLLSAHLFLPFQIRFVQHTFRFVYLPVPPLSVPCGIRQIKFTTDVASVMLSDMFP